LIAALALVAGCGGAEPKLRRRYLDEVAQLQKLTADRTGLISTLPQSAQKTLQEYADVTAEARRRYFAAVEAKDEYARKTATADEHAGNEAYDPAAERLLLEHVPTYPELQKRIAEQKARVEQAKALLEASEP
jgi:hypothetical protein